MGLTITSTDKSVTFSRIADEVYAKNRVDFELINTTVFFRIGQTSIMNEEVGNITVNGTPLTQGNAKGILSDALFRNASGDGDGSGGETNNWNQTDF